ncbi:MAG: hypothetical protein ACOCXZ_01105 [Chloroflexota bacterium]
MIDTVELSHICTGTPAGDRLNEDAAVAVRNGAVVTAAAIDGVTDRLISQALQPLFASYPQQPCNGSAYAARLTRDVIEADPLADPGALLLRANAALRAQVAPYYGGTLDAAAVCAAEPALAPYAADPRYLRLILPACVVTLARIDRAAARLDYAHLGDTELLLFHTDGRVTRAVAETRPNWQRGLIIAEDDDPQVRRYKAVGLLHNFVDANGQPDPTVGVGVINGLAEAASYIMTGSIDLAGVAAVCVCSDGFMWPAPAGETAADHHARLRHMRRIIDAAGLAGYVDRLRAEEAADAHRQLYPRPKTHDDATAILIRFL